MAHSSMPPELTLVLGGVRSGKSALAEEIAGQCGESVLYIATGQSTDAEMEQRILRHQERRSNRWQTLEESLYLADALDRSLAEGIRPDAILLDSVDVWVANLLLAHEEERAEAVQAMALSEMESLVGKCGQAALPAIFVSSEVGLSPVPPNRLGRQFQDLLGTVNQCLAAISDTVLLTVAGIPVRIKPK